MMNLHTKAPDCANGTRNSAEGSAIDIGYFDRRLPYVVTAEPLFDPAMTRLRG